jgi:hypothetical protein
MKRRLKRNYLNLENQRFNKLTVLKEVKNCFRRTWLCICDCGNKTKVKEYNLKLNAVKSCGCLNKEPKRLIDLTGRRFGRLIVLRKSKKRKVGRVSWICKCRCGEQISVRSYSLLNKDTRSCGCLRSDICIPIIRRLAKKQTGPNNPRWNPNLTDSERKRRRHLDRARIDKWRLKVFKRDNYICYISGLRGGNLQAHHVKPYAWYPRLRYLTCNGVTIRKDIHKLFHNKYGCKNIGWTQLKEFKIFYKLNHESN